MHSLFSIQALRRGAGHCTRKALEPPLRSKSAAEEGNHGAEGLIGGFGVKAGALVPGEGVFGGKEAGLVAHAGAFEAAIDRLASVTWDVRVLLPEDHEQLAANFFGAAERARVGVLTELAVVNSGAVPASGDAHIGLQRSAKREMSP